MHGTSSALTRRHFILTAATAAGGFMIGIGATFDSAEAATVVAQPWNDDNAYAANEIDAWIAIDPDDSILIRYQRSEMGNGSMTALPMLITEELQCDWSKVRIEYASPNRNVRENKVYGDMFSNGSRTIRGSQKKMQQVGASARERLIAAAAIWRAGGRRRQDQAGPGTRHQDARPVHFPRQADAAHRRGPQDRRIGQVRHRRAGAGHGVRGDHRLPGPWRQAQERR